MKLIETYSHMEEGYNPLLIGPKWQVAILNYSPSEDLANIKSLDVHYLTDEAFVLLKGKSVLISAAIEGDKITYDMVDMKPNVIYNIPKNVWHKIEMEPDSSVIIVEDSDTHKGDYEFYYLSDVQIEQFREEVKAAKNTL